MSITYAHTTLRITKQLRRICRIERLSVNNNLFQVSWKSRRSPYRLVDLLSGQRLQVVEIHKADEKWTGFPPSIPRIFPWTFHIEQYKRHSPLLLSLGRYGPSSEEVLSERSYYVPLYIGYLSISSQSVEHLYLHHQNQSNTEELMIDWYIIRKKCYQSYAHKRK